MQENLVIVESPAKAKTIEKFLGKDFIVKSSFGHIRDLSKKDLGIKVNDDLYYIGMDVGYNKYYPNQMYVAADEKLPTIENYISNTEKNYTETYLTKLK